MTWPFFGTCKRHHDLGFGRGDTAPVPMPTTWQPGHRQTHRLDLFRYPGFGPFDLYPREILRQLPPRHQLVYYNEITHWRYSQHGYIQMYPRADRDGNLPPSVGQEIYQRQPDQALTMVYDRLTFFAWPRYYHRVFQDLLRYGVGEHHAFQRNSRSRQSMAMATLAMVSAQERGGYG